MSNIKIHQKWCKKSLDIVVFSDNAELSSVLKEHLREYYKHNVIKKVACVLDMNLYTVRNWFNRDTGLKAIDLLKLLDNYDFIRNLLGFKKVVINNRITGKKNRTEVRKKLLQMLADNPNLTIKELALALEITPKSAEWRIYQLVKERRILRVGATKNGQWLVRS